MTGAIYAPMAQADMGGQLFVAEVELGQMRAHKTKLAVDIREPFLRMPFEEALRLFEERYKGDPAMIDVIRGYRKRAENVSKRTLDELANRVVAALESSLSNGGDMGGFARVLEDSPLGNSVQAGYLENVFRTNIGTAYGAGRLREIERSIDVIPYVQYRTSGDSRVRPAHAKLDGLIFNTKAEGWKDIAPPNSYQCRCVVVALDEEDVGDSSVVGEVTAEHRRGLDFLTPPTEAVTKPL